jgi:hypothetical protein
MTDNTETGRQRSSAGPAGDRLQHPKQALASASEQVRDEAARASAEVRQQGEEIASTAVEHADRYATKQKEAGAQHVESLARAVDRAAGELESTSPELARYARRAASSVDAFSDTLRQRSVRDLIDDTNDFARREPALFFAGAVVAGIVLSRFLRSSGEYESDSRHTDAGSYGSAAPAPGRHA